MLPRKTDAIANPMNNYRCDCDCCFRAKNRPTLKRAIDLFTSIVSAILFSAALLVFLKVGLELLAN